MRICSMGGKPLNEPIVDTNWQELARSSVAPQTHQNMKPTAGI